MASKVKKVSSGSLIQLISWCLWDAGGASIDAVTATFVFTVYLTSASFDNQMLSSQAVFVGMTVADITVALTAPITGQRADRRGKGTFWLTVFPVIVVTCLAGMFLVVPHPNFLWLGVGLLAAMTMFSESTTVNYCAMLSRISTPESAGRTSGIGWASGYSGGIILLMFLDYGFITEKNFMGIDTANGMRVRVATLVSALWSVIMFAPVIFAVWGRVVPGSEDLPRETLWESYRRLFRTIIWLFHKASNMSYFLVASAIFHDGLSGVFTFGGIIAGVTFGFSAGEVTLFAVAANIIADVATSAFGILDDRIGPRKVMLIFLIVLVSTCVAVFFLYDRGKIVFWTFGLFMTIWVGPAQLASRSSLSRRIPPGHEGEAFGLYQTTGRSVAWSVPLMFALFIGADSQLAPFYDPVLTVVTMGVGGSVLPVHEQAQYWDILGVTLVLLLGLLLLLPVEDTRPGAGGAPIYEALAGVAGGTSDSGMVPRETEENRGDAAAPNETTPREATTTEGAER